MTSRNFSQFMGVLFLAVGLLGFIPELRSGSFIGPTGTLAFKEGYGLLLGLFPVNLLHDLVHLAVGLFGLSSAKSMSRSRQFARGLTWFYGALAVMGLFPVFSTAFGLMPLYGHDIWLHAGTAVLANYFGYGQRAELIESVERYRRAA